MMILICLSTSISVQRERYVGACMSQRAFPHCTVRQPATRATRGYNNKTGDAKREPDMTEAERLAVPI